MSDRLYRSRDDRMLAGVAGGVAETLDADPSLIRIVWALLVVLTGGLAFLVYVVMAIVVPETPDGYVPPSARFDASQPGSTDAGPGTTPGPGAAPPGPVAEGGWIAPNGSVVPMAAGSSPTRRARRHRHGDRGGGVIAGIVLILIGGFFLVRQFVPSIDLGQWWPELAVGAGVVLIVLSVIPSGRRPD